MVFRKEIQMFGLLFFFLFSVLRLGTHGIQGLSDDNYGSSTCNFPAVFNFGDSNSDTGGISAAFYPIGVPNGETFFGKPSGRACDGRLILDFMAEELGIAYLRAYLDSLGLSSFKTGANFATGGSSIRQPGFSPFHLDVQISQFRQFKARIIDIANSTQGEADLPKPEDFSKALYTFDIGQNDLSYTLQTTSETETRAAIPIILDLFSTAIQQLYSEGARVFWVHNTGPIGCLPSFSKNYKPGDLDKNGCVVRLNEIAQEFNRQLKSKLTQLKANLTGVAFTYVDAYTAKYTLINNAESQGFVDPLDFCCCNRKIVGTPYYGPCAHPEKHISWDATHYTEAANRWVSNYILNGSMSDPPIPISQACHA
ncbi:hypothetical protein MKW94_013668 [Papaver nudicaule]|uniref:GDSL esterase/lipase At5g14450-like n=1 Tax=Papaver nudicaule TaxID=74823 RepID=A0AA41SDY8_PAPNU|nr:hypothetical protein [Papaver nudicaule]